MLAFIFAVSSLLAADSPSIVQAVAGSTGTGTDASRADELLSGETQEESEDAALIQMQFLQHRISEPMTSSALPPVASPITPTVEVAPGVVMPRVMVGTGGKLANHHARVFNLTSLWLHEGGRGIDTAHVYGNEADAASAVSMSGLPRDQLFILAKLPYEITSVTPSATAVRDAVASSMANLNVDYVDLMLIHWPGDTSINAAVWSQLEDLVCPTPVCPTSTGQNLRAIGVSDFDVTQLRDLQRTATRPIALNQRKLNVRHHDNSVLNFCRANNITYQAWAPLGEGSGEVLQNSDVQSIAKVHNRTPAQVALRWILERGATITVQSESSQHLREDMSLFDFNLTAEETQRLDALPPMAPFSWER